MKKFYPDVNITMIQKLYGLNLKDDQIASDSRMKIWTKDSKVDSKFRDYLDPKSKEFISILILIFSFQHLKILKIHLKISISIWKIFFEKLVRHINL